MFEAFVDRFDQNRPIISGTLPNESLITTFYSKYRHVYLTKETANFFKIAKSLSVASNSDLFTLYHRHHLKKAFYQEFLLKFAFIQSQTSFTPDQVIDIWFNAYFFHGQQKEREKQKEELTDIREETLTARDRAERVMGEEGCQGGRQSCG